MSDANQINHELARLDSERVRRRIDEGTFRAARRQLLLDFQPHHRPPAPTASAGQGESPTQRPEPRPSRPAAATESVRSSGNVMKIAAAIVAATIVLSLLWMNRTPDEAPACPPIIAPQPASDLPQDAATALIESEWSGGDIADFLRRWHELSPEAIRAAEDDPRIWLLRGETEQRLGTARAARSLDESAEAAARLRQLESLQRVIRAPRFDP